MTPILYFRLFCQPITIEYNLPFVNRKIARHSCANALLLWPFGFARYLFTASRKGTKEWQGSITCGFYVPIIEQIRVWDIVNPKSLQINSTFTVWSRFQYSARFPGRNQSNISNGIRAVQWGFLFPLGSPWQHIFPWKYIVGYRTYVHAFGPELIKSVKCSV